ncbi:hypothetical protein C5167_037598 [Papaver somniferum]|uniref:BZIP domain-containing protein n=1 Tax=Papaver somniferum TaxID=3469 RepID=A0A4Y7IAI2_PAPSO|nr:bZIP transcription factor 11-like [Papaver somniferum]RZC44651.1 hypothetical protein C5167_037598 [Papaver somniferum]
MASSSTTTGSGTSSGGSLDTTLHKSGSEGDLQQHVEMDQRKRKRMLSNRESARRSRMRKQKHLDELMDQVTQIRKENNQILTSVNLTTQHYVNIESENSILRAQMDELNNRLQSLTEISHYLTANNNNNNTLDNNIGNIGFDYQTDFMNPNYQNYYNQQQQPIMVNTIHDMNPWNMPSSYMSQPIMASADMFQY